jgi:hypothetical protein
LFFLKFRQIFQRLYVYRFFAIFLFLRSVQIHYQLTSKYPQVYTTFYKYCFPKITKKTISNNKFALQFLTVFKHFITFIRFKIKVAHHFGNGADEKVNGIHPVGNGADEKVDGIHLVGNVADEKVNGIHPVENGV